MLDKCFYGFIKSMIIKRKQGKLGNGNICFINQIKLILKINIWKEIGFLLDFKELLITVEHGNMKKVITNKQKEKEI